jgi:hypothetical protein
MKFSQYKYENKTKNLIVVKKLNKTMADNSMKTNQT